MKDRITLAALIIILWVLLIIFQKYLPTQIALMVFIGFMCCYATILQAATSHQKRKYRKNPPKLNYDYKPFVSILIPGHNEESVIANTVENMVAIDYPNYEIIVIDDRSIDNTAAVLAGISKKYAGKVKSIIRDKNAFPGKSAVLNEALESSKGEVICVFDADARITPDFLTNIMPYLAEEDTGAVQARKMIINKDFNILTKCQNNEYTLDTHFQRGRDTIKGAVELRGNGQLIKREALFDIGGWNIYTITDDLDISTRLHLKGWDVRFCHDIVVYEEGITKFWALMRQRRRWVEGSIRRYLEYFTDILFSKDISLRASLDMWAYISEFVLPVWLISEWCIQGFKLIKGYDNHFLSSLALILLAFIFFFSGLVYSLRRYNNLSYFQSVKQALETGVYLVSIWTPVVIYIVIKIIFTKRTMDWGKTAHGLEMENAATLEAV